MTLKPPPTALFLALAGCLLAGRGALAGAPPPGPKAGAAAAVEKRQPARPGLKDVREMDLSAAVKEAEKACAKPGAGREDRECLAALLLLAGRGAQGRKVLAGLLAPAEPRDGKEALAGTAKLLKAEVEKLPAPVKGQKPGREEALARLRLAMVSLALGRPGPAYAVLEPVDPCGGKFELERLALRGLASWSLGSDKREAKRLFEDLLRRAASGNVLGLRELRLVDRVQSYGVYTERSAKTVARGESVLAYCEVVNFQCRQTDSGSHLTALDLDLSFEEEAEVQGRRGGKARQRRIIRTMPGFARVRHRTRSHLRDLHLVIRFNVPEELAPGREYLLKVTAREEGSGRTAASSLIPLKVRRGR